MKYIIGGIILGTLVGVFNGFSAIRIFEPNKKIYKAMIMIISIIIFSIICTFGLQYDSKNFNNGYCIKCGTKYEPLTHKNGRTYYECPNCYFGTWH